MKKALLTKLLALSVLLTSNAFADMIVVNAPVKSVSAQSGTSEDHKFWIDFDRHDADGHSCTGSKPFRVYIVPHKGNVEAVKRSFVNATLALLNEKTISVWTYASGRDCGKGHAVTIHAED